ncbi:hypothetical protein [Pontibacter russatus]|uniref:hypothetical protein n=1 Tax=Pontibacter russatus TaxID=2694929 RepID=UPI00137B18F2|nr:hypothetical protein [Pontibacter russatus]
MTATLPRAAALLFFFPICCGRAKMLSSLPAVAPVLLAVALVLSPVAFLLLAVALVLLIVAFMLRWRCAFVAATLPGVALVLLAVVLQLPFAPALSFFIVL